MQKFVVVSPYNVRANRKSRNLGTLGRRPCDKGTWLIPRSVLQCQFRWFYVIAYERNDGDPPKNWPWRLASQGHSRSLKLTRIDRLPMTFCYWSIVTMGLSRTVLEINGDFCRKILHPLVLIFNALLSELPLEFCNGAIAQKQQSFPYLTMETASLYVHSFRYNARAWHTDRRTDLLTQYRGRHA